MNTFVAKRYAVVLEGNLILDRIPILFVLKGLYGESIFS